MQVEVPGRGERGVFVENVLVDVVLFQHVVAQQPARFAFAGDVGHPAQFAVAEFAVITESVFQETPIRIDHQQTVVADAFEIGDLVEIHAGFPFPLAHRHLLAVRFVEPQAIAEHRKIRLFTRIDRIPLHRRTHRHPVGGRRGQLLTEFVPALAAHPEIGPGQKPDRAVARTVGEKRRFEKRLLPGFDVADDHRSDPAAGRVPDSRRTGRRSFRRR